MTPVMEAATRAKEVLARVRQRLEDGGGVVELGQLDEFSADEVDVLLRLERNGGIW